MTKLGNMSETDWTLRFLEGVRLRKKELRKEQNKRYKEKHQEQMKEQQKKYYEEHQEEIKERRKKYRENHQEEIKERHKKYYEEHCEEIKAKKRARLRNMKDMAARAAPLPRTNVNFDQNNLENFDQNK